MGKSNKKAALPAKRDAAGPQIRNRADATEQDAAPSLNDSEQITTLAADVETDKTKAASPAVEANSKIRRRKPCGIGIALRQRGFDEHTIADHYVTVAERLKGKSDKSGNVEKLLVDVLKECSKYIEPARPSDRLSERSLHAPVHIHLIHNVSRPARSAREPRAEQVIDVESAPSSTGSNSDSDSGTAPDSGNAPSVS
jgi:hypothetical protein